MVVGETLTMKFCIYFIPYRKRMPQILRALLHRRRPLLKKREDRTVTFTLKELMDLNPMLLRHPYGPH